MSLGDWCYVSIGGAVTYRVFRPHTPPMSELTSQLVKFMEATHGHSRYLLHDFQFGVEYSPIPGALTPYAEIGLELRSKMKLKMRGHNVNSPFQLNKDMKQGK